MRRSSPIADQICAALADAGVRVSPRRLEGWTLQGLGADESSPLDEQVCHYRALSTLAGPGRGRNADVAALRLAAHGFPCRRLRAALLRTCKVAEGGEPPVALDFATDASSDAAFDQLELIAKGMVASIADIPQPMRRVVQTVRRNVVKCAARMDESADALFQSVIVNFMCLLLGGEIYDERAIAALSGIDPSEIEPEAVQLINERLAVRSWELDEAYRTEPLSEVVAVALWLREHACLAVSFLGLDKATGAQLDELAAQFAPCALHLLRVVASRFDDAESLLADLELPVGLDLLRPSAPALSA